MELVKLIRQMKHVGSYFTRNGICKNGFIRNSLSQNDEMRNDFIRARIIRARFITKKDGFGLNELLGIAAAIIIAAFIVIPSMRTFTQNLMNGLANWWNNIIANKIFPTT